MNWQHHICSHLRKPLRLLQVRKLGIFINRNSTGQLSVLTDVCPIHGAVYISWISASISIPVVVACTPGQVGVEGCKEVIQGEGDDDIVVYADQGIHYHVADSYSWKMENQHRHQALGQLHRCAQCSETQSKWLSVVHCCNQSVSRILHLNAKYTFHVLAGIFSSCTMLGFGMKRNLNFWHRTKTQLLSTGKKYSQGTATDPTPESKRGSNPKTVASQNSLLGVILVILKQTVTVTEILRRKARENKIKRNNLNSYLFYFLKNTAGWPIKHITSSVWSNSLNSVMPIIQFDLVLLSHTDSLHTGFDLQLKQYHVTQNFTPCWFLDTKSSATATDDTHALFRQNYSCLQFMVVLHATQLHNTWAS